LRRLLLTQRAAVTVGLSLVMVGASLVGFVAVASASGPSVTVSPHSHLVAGESVIVRGKGFIHGSNGAVLECNDAAGQPAINIQIHGEFHAVPVGCTDPLPATTSKLGRLATKGLVVVTGTLGTWETGTDSAGNPAATDSSNYPCPPNVFQQDDDVSCVFEFIDNKGQEAFHTVGFKTSGITTTTTSTTTSTTGPCAAQSATVTASAGDGDATVTVNPATCLVNGTVADVSGTGLMPSSNSNFLGTLLECNSDPTQPTVNELGNAIPVSCTGATSHTFTPNAGGTLSTTFSIVEGVTGPPASGTDSAGNPAATDAANYPCPPTAAQVSVGDTCIIHVGDSGGDQVTVPIAFNPG
jgi:hypothetical protein